MVYEKPNDGDALYQQGYLSLESNDFANAIHFFTQAQAISPDDHEIMHLMGVALQGLNRHDEAITQFKNAIDRFHEFPEALADLGDSLRVIGNSEEARTAYDRALALILPGEETIEQIMSGLEQLNHAP